jgi:nitroreductase
VDVFEAVRTVLAVREYEDKPVPPDALRRILDAAHLTASSRNGQPWHFIVVQDKAKIQRLATLVASGPYMADAPLVIAVAVEKDSPYGHSDAGRAIQSMALTAWSEGIGSNWVGYEGVLDHIAPELNLPNELSLIGLVPFGYPVKKLGLGKKRRKPFSEVVHSENYGTPFS